MMMRLTSAMVWLAVGVVGAGVVAPTVDAQEPESPRKITKRVAPVYPPLARQSHLTGTVKLVLGVAPEGNVKSVRTVGGNPIFVAAAEEAVKKWKFESAKKESTEVVAIKFDNPEP